MQEKEPQRMIFSPNKQEIEYKSYPYNLDGQLIKYYITTLWQRQYPFGIEKR